MKRETARCRIVQMAQGMNTVSDYYCGTGEVLTPYLPHNVVCFSRLASSPLKALPPHQHHRMMLLVAVEGRGKVSVDMETFALEPGEALLIFPFSFHAYTDFPESGICWLFITFEKGTFQEMEPLRGAGGRRLGEVEWMLLAETVACWREPNRHPLVAFHLGLLLRRLGTVEGAGEAEGASGAGEALGTGAALLRKVNRYLFPRLDQPLPVGKIARAMGQSESHFRARFRAVAGMGLGQHVRRLRMKRASDLLHTTSLSVSEIARQCGFDSLYAFSRAFKTEYGVSPRGYRQLDPFRLSPEGVVSPFRLR